ncbi:GntR family transcriptional regulator [Kitasatospora sp. NPDC057015]|uniref:GntR family transcriptional regulator n=1 Tax=Kitasatospora sp. NPDC057015 TaxID=3346001 RepID=UPI00362D864C
MSQPTSGVTRSQDVHRRLREDILGGRLVPGQRLKFPDLCRDYGTSVGAVREALVRLTGEGLVRAQAHQGYTVTPLSHDDLRELATARVEIESVVLRLSMEQGDTQWEARAVAAHHVLRRTPFFGPDDPDHPGAAWAAAHAEFHLALLAGCTNRRLLETARGLREEAELYLHWSAPFGVENDRDLAGEHRALLEAVVDREVGRAVGLVRDHIAHTARLLITCAPDDQWPAPPTRGDGEPVG